MPARRSSRRPPCGCRKAHACQTRRNRSSKTLLPVAGPTPGLGLRQQCQHHSPDPCRRPPLLPGALVGPGRSSSRWRLRPRSRRPQAPWWTWPLWPGSMRGSVNRFGSRSMCVFAPVPCLFTSLFLSLSLSHSLPLFDFTSRTELLSLYHRFSWGQSTGIPPNELSQVEVMSLLDALTCLLGTADGGTSLPFASVSSTSSRSPTERLSPSTGQAGAIALPVLAPTRRAIQHPTPATALLPVATSQPSPVAVDGCLPPAHYFSEYVPSPPPGGRGGVPLPSFCPVAPF